MTKNVLIVDSERDSLRAIHGLFKGTHYDALFFDSAEDALIHLSDHSADLVISDIRMPGMGGIEFLRKVRERCPETMRVTLTKPGDTRMVLRVLEENLAKMYLTKPLDNSSLIGVVDRMFELEAILKDRKILDLINTMDDLPTIPDLYHRIRTMISQDEDVDKIARLIESDQASSSRILRIANSSFYGNSTGSIQQAIMVIGLINVKNIVLSNSVFILAGGGRETVRELWRNATLTNRYASLFYQQFLDQRMPNRYASAGLLHNIGMAVLMLSHGKDYEGMMADSGTDSQALLDRERAAYGITHQELGGYLLNWWEMPLPIVETALFHHTPLDPRIINKELTCTIHIANSMAWRHMTGDALTEDRVCSLKDCCSLLHTDSAVVTAFFDGLADKEE